MFCNINDTPMAVFYHTEVDNRSCQSFQISGGKGWKSQFYIIFREVGGDWQRLNDTTNNIGGRHRRTLTHYSITPTTTHTRLFFFLLAYKKHMEICHAFLLIIPYEKGLAKRTTCIAVNQITFLFCKRCTTRTNNCLCLMGREKRKKVSSEQQRTLDWQQDDIGPISIKYSSIWEI